MDTQQSSRDTIPTPGRYEEQIAVVTVFYQPTTKGASYGFVDPLQPKTIRVNSLNSRAGSDLNKSVSDGFASDLRDHCLSDQKVISTTEPILLPNGQQSFLVLFSDDHPVTAVDNHQDKSSPASSKDSGAGTKTAFFIRVEDDDDAFDVLVPQQASVSVRCNPSRTASRNDDPYSQITVRFLGEEDQEVQAESFGLVLKRRGRDSGNSLGQGDIPMIARRDLGPCHPAKKPEDFSFEIDGERPLECYSEQFVIFSYKKPTYMTQAADAISAGLTAMITAVGSMSGSARRKSYNLE